MYDDIEIEVFKGKDKGTEPYFLNPSNINYYRGFTDDSSQLKTMLYMQGSVKGIILNCGHEYLRNRLKQHKRIHDLMMNLNDDQLKEVEMLVDDMKK